MSDIEYKNKYLKYKVKYINLKNEIEQQEGGVSWLKKGAEKAVKIIDTAKNLSTMNYRIIFFYVEKGGKMPDFLQKQVINMNDSLQYFKSGVGFEVKKLQTDYKGKIWYWENKAEVIKLNTATNIPLECTLNKALKIDNFIKLVNTTYKTFDKSSLDTEKIDENEYTNNENVKTLIKFIQTNIKLIKTKIKNDKNNACTAINGALEGLLNCASSINSEGVWYGAWVDFGIKDKNSKVYLVVKDKEVVEAEAEAEAEAKAKA
jgi:hypothetical protein